MPQHQALIGASNITPDVAAERGYRSVLATDELQLLGFAGSQLRAPGLVIPIRDAFGQNGLYQFRPDDPRPNDAGKPIKYETLAESHLALDVPRRVRPPRISLWVTEGARNVDAAVSNGLCCVSVNWV